MSSGIGDNITKGNFIIMKPAHHKLLLDLIIRDIIIGVKGINKVADNFFSKYQQSRILKIRKYK